MATTSAKITLNNIGPVSAKQVRYYHLKYKGNNICPKKLAIRSATVLGNNICQDNEYNGLTSAIKSININICPIKIQGQTNTHTPSCVGK